MTLSLIAARSSNNVIGSCGKIPWTLPEDMQHFKELTLGHSVIMGRKTWDSLPEAVRPLPGRRNIVLTKTGLCCAIGYEVVSTLAEALSLTIHEDEVFVIGGGSIYREALPFADRIYMTEVDTVVEGDTFFPTIKPSDWIEFSRTRCCSKRDNVFFSYVEYRSYTFQTPSISTISGFVDCLSSIVDDALVQVSRSEINTITVFVSKSLVVEVEDKCRNFTPVSIQVSVRPLSYEQASHLSGILVIQE